MFAPKRDDLVSRALQMASIRLEKINQSDPTVHPDGSIELPDGLILPAHGEAGRRCKAATAAVSVALSPRYADGTSVTANLSPSLLASCAKFGNTLGSRQPGSIPRYVASPPGSIPRYVASPPLPRPLLPAPRPGTSLQPSLAFACARNLVDEMTSAIRPSTPLSHSASDRIENRHLTTSATTPPVLHPGP